MLESCVGPCAYGVGWFSLSAAQRWQHDFCCKGLKLPCTWAPWSPTKPVWVSRAEMLPQRSGGVAGDRGSVATSASSIARLEEILPGCVTSGCTLEQPWACSHFSQGLQLRRCSSCPSYAEQLPPRCLPCGPQHRPGFSPPVLASAPPQ